MGGTDYTYDDGRMGEDGAVSITWKATCSNSVTSWDKTKKAVVSVFITSAAHTPASEAFKLRWRNKTDSGSFADLVTGSGELRAGASAGCITNTDPVGDSAGCEASNVDASEEVENESPLLSASLSCAKEHFIETQWCVDFSNALDGKEYEFEIYSSTEGEAVGTVVPTITTIAGVTEQACDGAFTPTGALTKQTSKYPSGALSSIVGVLSTILTKVKSVAGGFTPTGALSRQTSKFPSGTLGLAGALIRQTYKYPSGTLGLAGDLVKQISKYPSGSVDFAGALNTVYMKAQAVAGGFTPTGTLVKQTSKYPSGSVTPTGVLTKQTSKYPDGTLGLAGVLNAVKLAIQSCAGAFAPSGALTRMTSKFPGGSLDLSGALSKKVSDYYTGEVTFTGYLNTQKIPGSTSKPKKKQVAYRYGLTGIYIPSND